MNRPLPTLAIIFLLAVSYGRAAREDTVGLRAVEVTSTSWTEVDAHVLPTASVTAEDLLRLRPMTTAEALRGIPGLYVRDYGGIGGLRSVSIRGGSSAQSLVLVDGFRWNSAQNGGVDLSWVPATMLERIDVQRGASSALHGANAMTGTVDLRLSSPATSMVQATADAGSFDTWRLQASGSAVTSDVKISAAAEHYATAGTYAYDVTIDDADAELLRANADARSTSGMVRVDADVFSITAMGRTADRGVPGAVVEGAQTQPMARLDDLDLWALATAKVVEASSSSVDLRLGGRYLDQHYTDPDATFSGLDGIDARYLLRDVSADAVWRLSSTDLLHRATFSAGYVDLRGESLDPDIGNLAVRRTAALSYDVQWTVDERLLIESALRGDVYSDVGSAISGSLGGRWKMHDDVVLRASIGTGFRPPSFNELYFLNYGNTNLKPERSIMASVGGVWSPISWFNIDANVFTSQITNLIVGIPMSPVVTSAQNIGNALSSGLELATRCSLLDDRLFGQWSYTLQRVEDRTGRAGIDGTLVPYVPMELIAVQSWWDDGTTIASLEWNYASYRYAQPGAESSSLLAPYHLVHASVGQVIAARDVNVTLLFRIDNLLDERYVVIRGYPMPGRSLRLTLSVRS